MTRIPQRVSGPNKLFAVPVSTKIMRILVEGKALENLLLDKAFIDLELPLFDEEVLAGFDGTVHFTKQYLPQGAALKTPLEKVWGGLRLEPGAVG